MKQLTTKGQKILYAVSGLGVNMLNLMMGSYLCSAIIASGFTAEAAVNQTFCSKDLVIIALWSIFGVIAKVIDGIIDIPMASFADNLRTKYGRRRPAIVMGLIPMIIAYLLFLVVPNPCQATLLNTVYLGVVLCVFYSFYTLTMVTYYATFTEIVDSASDRNFISNVKSVCDILYFILGYVVVRAMLGSINITLVSLIVLPIVLTMLIPLFMIKEPDNRGTVGVKAEKVSILASLSCTFKNKPFIVWMCVYSFMTFSVQLFLSGINEYFADTGMSMMIVMVASFAPVPLTMMIYNKLFRTKGFGTAFRYALVTFSVGMLCLFGVSFVPQGTLRTMLSIAAGLVSSLSIGSLFSVAYSVPSQLAAEEQAKSGVSNSAMYFAVQGLFSGVATAIGSYVVLNALKSACGVINDPYVYNPMYIMTLICAAVCLVAFGMTYLLPKSLSDMGKK